MCLKDLKERFARVEIHVSAPLIAFRESAFLPAEAPDVMPKPYKVMTKANPQDAFLHRKRDARSLLET